jgi:hypothetical protein
VKNELILTCKIPSRHSNAHHLVCLAMAGSDWILKES